MLPTLRIALRDASALRPYQERSLAKMFGNGRARSGIIVLPCGAGKTLVGIAAAATMGKSCIVLCPNQTSVQQWVEQFARFTDVRVSSLVTLTAKKKEPLPDLHEAVILLTTYSMIGRIREENAYYGSAAAAAAAGHGGGKKLAKNARRGGVSAEVRTCVSSCRCAPFARVESRMSLSCPCSLTLDIAQALASIHPYYQQLPARTHLAERGHSGSDRRARVGPDAAGRGAPGGSEHFQEGAAAARALQTRAHGHARTRGREGQVRACAWN